MALITYTMAVNHLNQQGVLDSVSPEDPDLIAKMESATSLVLIHLKRQGEWTVETDPETDPEFAIVQAAILKVLGNLYRFRGDDEKTPDPVDQSVVSMCSMLRDGAIA